MRIENPTPLEAMALPMINRGDRTTLTVIVKGTFSFAAQKTQLADNQIPIALGDQLYDKQNGGGIRYETDLVPFKPKTDVVLSGIAYAPENHPVDKVDVALKLGPVKKYLRVYGKRLWNYSGLLSRSYTITDTKPFVTCPIRYSEAFGGVDPSTGEYCDRNLAGKGFYSVKTKTKLTGWPLPRIEDPKALIRRPEDHPKPVGFGFYHRAWQPRAACAGTFDDAWRKKRSPKPPEDFNYHFYNGAHPDLQVKGYLNGDEPVELVNLTPDGRVRFNLPGIAPTCSVKRIKETDAQVVTMKLDTVFIEPDKYLFCLVWRGAAQLAALSEAEIEAVSIAVDEGP
jgi:hypothetical protein